MSFTDTIKAGLSNLATAIENGAVEAVDEVKTIVEGVASDEWTQAKKLFGQSSIGGFIENSISEAKASGVSIETKFNEIVSGTLAEIAKLDSEGGLLKGMESEALTFATSLVSDGIAAFEGNTTGATFLALAEKLV